MVLQIHFRQDARKEGPCGTISWYILPVYLVLPAARASLVEHVLTKLLLDLLAGRLNCKYLLFFQACIHMPIPRHYCPGGG